MNLKAQRDLSIAGDVVGRDKITINLPPPLPPAEAKDRANLLILLRKVKTFWIEGVLEKSVHNAVLLELGKETKPEAVDHPWGMVLELPDQSNQVLPSGTKIIDIFEKMNRALLILGEPGSGKTITLLELARDLIIRAEADPTQPIPVVFNLSSWTGKRQLLVDWLMFELNTKYQIPKKIGRAWLKDNRILPLLDGLDEVKPENRTACVEAINHFGEAFGLPGCVVCSRLQEYSILPVRLKLNSAICLQLLTLTQVNSYLEAGGSKLANLHSALQKDEALQELAKSTLMLNIMSLTYQDVSFEILTNRGHDRIEDQGKNLFNEYITSMFKRKGKAKQPYTVEQTMNWLAWVAQNMRKHNQSIFLIEQLQPSCLMNRRQHWVYALSSRIITGLSYFLILNLYNLVFPWRVLWLSFLFIMASFIQGMFFGLIGGLIDGLRFARFNKATGVNNVWQAVIYVLIFWSICLLIRLPESIIGAILEQSLVPLGFGLILGLRSRNRTLSNDNHTVEKINWSWVYARKGIIKGTILGMILGLIFYVMRILTTADLPMKLLEYLLNFIVYLDFTFAQAVWVSVALISGLVGGFWGFLLSGLKHSIVETKNLPNQGIKWSIKNSLSGGLIVCLSIVTILALSRGLLIIVLMGQIIIPFAFLWHGGMDVIQHYILRFILCCKRYTPWNYARFLDYATSLIFLQKVGGGYIFIHSLLLEHFAAMPLQSKSQKK